MSQDGQREQVYSVYSPEGTHAFQERGRPPAVPLESAVIGQLWDMAFRGDLIFAELRKELTSAYPAVEFVSYREFGDIHGPREREVVRTLPDRLEEFGCTAVVAGIGA
jgi:hypothetical protein